MNLYRKIQKNLIFSNRYEGGVTFTSECHPKFHALWLLLSPWIFFSSSTFTGRLGIIRLLLHQHFHTRWNFEIYNLQDFNMTIIITLTCVCVRVRKFVYTCLKILTKRYKQTYIHAYIHIHMYTYIHLNKYP